jgi:hypothetical protein
MGYVGETNVAITAGGVADLMWALKSALLKAGWRLMSAGTGTGGAYTAPNQDGVTAVADPFTTASTLNVSGAWFRIKEPGTTTVGREYVLMRGSAATTVSIKYSRATGFTSGSPNATTSPTTGTEGDGVVVSHTATDSAATVATSGLTSATATSGFIQAVASDVADANGVWSFYVWSYVGGTGVTNRIFATEGSLPGSHHPADQDTSYFLNLNPATNGAANNTIVRFWNGYNRTGSGYIVDGRYGLPSICIRTAVSPGSNVLAELIRTSGDTYSAYDGKIQMFPFAVHRTNSTVNGSMWKGFSSNIVCFGTNQNDTDTFNLNTANAKIAVWVGAGWQFAVPWITGISPQV